MAINSLETAKRYTDALDKAVLQKAVTGFFADNVFKAKFAGAKTVIMPDISFVGLADYNRDSGFSLAGTTISNTSYTLTKDRGRKLQIDREDMDETGVADLAGQILSEYVRTQVAPEMDAYILSKLAKVASDKSHKTTYTAAKAANQLATAINNVQSRIGYDEELVAFCDSAFYAQLMNSTEFSRNIIVSDFSKGGISTRVKYFNGVALLPVTDDRIREEYDFKAGTAASSSAAATGGFAPKASAGYTRALVIPKKGASLVKKTETLRIFTPEQNIDADAYAFNYRLYYDVFVKKSNLDSIETIITAGTTQTGQGG